MSFGDTRGHELRGPHYAIVIQSEAYPLNTVLIIPLSSSARATDWRVPIVLNGQRTYALVEQLRVVDKESRLKERVGSIAGTSELTMIEEELSLILGIHPMYRDADE